MEIDSDLFASLNVSELDKTAIDGYSYSINEESRTRTERGK